MWGPSKGAQTASRGAQSARETMKRNKDGVPVPAIEAEAASAKYGVGAVQARPGHLESAFLVSKFHTT